MIILDTHAWFWWLAESPQLSPTADEMTEVSALAGAVEAGRL